MPWNRLFTNSGQVHSLFVTLQKNDWVIMGESIHGNIFHTLVCPLMLIKNYTDVWQSLNIICRRCQICGKLSHIRINYTYFMTVTKKTCLHWIDLFMAKFELIRIVLLCLKTVQKCSVTQHQCRRRQMCGTFSTHLATSTLTFCPWLEHWSEQVCS